MLARSSSVVSRKRLARDQFDTFATHARVVYDVTLHNGGHKMAALTVMWSFCLLLFYFQTLILNKTRNQAIVCVYFYIKIIIILHKIILKINMGGWGGGGGVRGASPVRFPFKGTLLRRLNLSCACSRLKEHDPQIFAVQRAIDFISIL